MAAVAVPVALTCLAPVGQARVVRSMLEIRDEQVVRQQWDLSCGAAAIATVLTYQLNDPVSEREVALAMLRHTSPTLVRQRLGFSLLDLKAYAATHGYAVAAYQDMTLDDLDPLAPAITPISAHGLPHFVVYRGRRDGRVLIADPAFGNRTMSEDAFRAAWAHGVGFIVFDPRNPRAPNRMGAPAELFLTPGLQARRQAISGPRMPITQNPTGTAP
ncbi:MAG TPA: C39 family peptidase [Caulobacteraceae bacterium]|nr:C39 family peptidase [Caulobacteraceae bacterium]